MGKAATFDPADRLPWLSEPASKPAPKRSLGTAAIVALALAAGAAGAAGYTALQRAMAPEQPQAQIGPVETVRLPPPVAAQPAPLPPEAQALELPAAPAATTPEPAPAPMPSAKAPAARPKARVAASKKPVRKVTSELTSATAQTSTAGTATSPNYDPRAWNSGVQGRIIQLGAFRTQAQANGQWSRVYYRYPLLRPLPPRVVRTSIRGRTYYRLQLGTFSHAHSEALCHRMRASGEGCLVLGLNRGRRG